MEVSTITEAARHPHAGIEPNRERALTKPLRVPLSTGGQLDQQTRALMEPRFGTDFTRVQVHNDAAAAEGAAARGALAYTTGSDIFFASGQYRPQTTAGRYLIAHELAHVVQQAGQAPVAQHASLSSNPGDAPEQAAHDAAVTFTRAEPPTHSVALLIRDRLRATRLDRPVVQRSVASWAGDFDTDTYTNVLDKAKNPVGVDITLRFKPGKQVDATKIGMTQLVTSRDQGKLAPPNATVDARSIALGKAGEGAHIDQLARFSNPLYATGATGAKDTLSSTATVTEWGRHGWRYTDTKGKSQRQDALLKDTPKLDPHGANAGQVFESAALAVSGVQQGTYYGSVQWGWRTNAVNAFTRLPLTLVSEDVPTATFTTAAGLWAAKPTSTGKATIPLPTALGKFTHTAGSWLVSNPSKAEATILGKLAKNTRLEVTDKGVALPFNKAAKHQWWKATVVEGTYIGRVGWIMESMLSDVRT